MSGDVGSVCVAFESKMADEMTESRKTNVNMAPDQSNAVAEGAPASVQDCLVSESSFLRTNVSAVLQLAYLQVPFH